MVVALYRLAAMAKMVLETSFLRLLMRVRSDMVTMGYMLWNLAMMGLDISKVRWVIIMGVELANGGGRVAHPSD